jgi:hypothetical protein
VVSFKYLFQDVLAGRHDAALRSWFASMPTDRRIDWPYWHEPDDQIYKDRTFTAAQYRSAFRPHPADLEGAPFTWYSTTRTSTRQDAHHSS